MNKAMRLFYQKNELDDRRKCSVNYGLITKDVEITRNMPSAFRRKEIIRNWYVFIFEIPIRLTPISSGNGEAIMIAPITGSVQLKYLL